MTPSTRDIVITWPKTRAFESYLSGLALAATKGEVINFRVPTLPKEFPSRCYVVYDGNVRGYSAVLDLCERGENEVMGQNGEYWPAGKYIVRSPILEPIEWIPMKGFQGWRYFDRRDDGATHS